MAFFILVQGCCCFLLTLNLIQQGSYTGHYVRGREAERGRAVRLCWMHFHLASLTPTLSADVLQEALCSQRRSLSNKTCWSGGWEGLLVNWQPREYRVLSPRCSPTHMLSFPFFYPWPLTDCTLCLAGRHKSAFLTCHLFTVCPLITLAHTLFFF